MLRTSQAANGSREAVALLKLTKAAINIHPPLQSAAGSALSIADVISKFKTNKKEWTSFAQYINDSLASVIQSLPDANQPIGDLEQNMKKLKLVLDDILLETQTLQREPAYALKWLWTAQRVAGKIADLRKQYDDALELFHLGITIDTGFATENSPRDLDMKRVMDRVVDKFSGKMVSNLKLTLDSDISQGWSYIVDDPETASVSAETGPTSLSEDVVHPMSIIHTAKLPTMDVSLDNALMHFDMNTISPWMNPMEWIKADSSDIIGIINKYSQLVTVDEIDLADVDLHGIIYPRLIVYILSHLTHCARDKKALNDFGETVKQWGDWDIIDMVENHQIMKNYLIEVFNEHLQAHGLHPGKTFRELLNLDVIRLCAQLTVIVTDGNLYNQILARRGPGAQSLLDLLQARLDFYIHPTCKHRHVKALMKLSRASGLYPECLVLKGVDIEGHPVARGGYGDVYRGLLHGKEIAVKVLRIYQDSDLVKLLKGFSSEAVLWRQLSHPNVLPFYGVYHLEEQTRRLCLTAPWMENGNVVDFLRRHPDTDCVHLALDISRGLEYLHTLKPSVIHGDLKGLNVLITKSRRACIGDFGLATAKDSKTLVMSHTSATKTGGTLRWQAPELLSPDEAQHSSKASDIYAFACVCYEMFSGDVPFFENPSDIRVILSVMQGKRPTPPSHDLSKIRGLSDAVWKLIETCWAQDSKTRPTAQSIAVQLNSLPNRPVDERLVDDFLDFRSPMLYTYVEHPFYTLFTTTQKLGIPHLTASFRKDGHEKSNESAVGHTRLSESESFEDAEDDFNTDTWCFPLETEDDVSSTTEQSSDPDSLVPRNFRNETMPDIVTSDMLTASQATGRQAHATLYPSDVAPGEQLQARLQQAELEVRRLRSINEALMLGTAEQRRAADTAAVFQRL